MLDLLDALMRGYDSSTLAERLARLREPWMSAGACVGKPREWWFPARGESTAAAKAICADCPVKGPCLEYAVEGGRETVGIWAGTSDKERRLLRRGHAA